MQRKGKELSEEDRQEKMTVTIIKDFALQNVTEQCIACF